MDAITFEQTEGHWRLMLHRALTVAIQVSESGHPTMDALNAFRAADAEFQAVNRAYLDQNALVPA